MSAMTCINKIKLCPSDIAKLSTDIILMPAVCVEIDGKAVKVFPQAIYVCGEYKGALLVDGLGMPIPGLGDLKELVVLEGCGCCVGPDGGDGKCCEKEVHQYKTKKYIFNWENTKTSWKNSYEQIKFHLRNGTFRYVDIPKITSGGYLAQMTAAEAAMKAAFPELCDVSNRRADWKTPQLPQDGNGSIPKGDSFGVNDLCPPLVGQHIQFTACPDEVEFLPIFAEFTMKNGEPRSTPCVFKPYESPVEYIQVCLSCDKDCSDEIPKCAIPAGENFPVIEGPQCDYDIKPVCEITPGGQIINDEDELVDYDPVIFQSDIFVQFTICDGVIVDVYAYTLDTDGNAQDHNLTEGNYYGNCDTLEAIGTAVECPANCVFTKQSYDLHAAAMDNNNWDGAGNKRGLIRPGSTSKIKFNLADGTSFIFDQTPSANAFGQLEKWAAAFKAEGHYCEVGIYCDNRAGCSKSPYPNAPSQLAWPVDVAFGNYLYVQGCDPTKLPVSAEVLEGDHVGAINENTGHKTIKGVVYYECITCDATYYKDCNNNPISKPCCTCTVTPVQVDLSEYETLCYSCCRGKIPTDRGGVGNPSLSTNFEYGTVTGATWSEFLENLITAGATYGIVPLEATGHVSEITICGLKGETIIYNIGKEKATIVMICEEQKALLTQHCGPVEVDLSKYEKECCCNIDGMAMINTSQIYTEGQGEGIWDTKEYGLVPEGLQGFNYGASVSGYPSGSTFAREFSGDGVAYNSVSTIGITANTYTMNQETAGNVGTVASLPDERDLVIRLKVIVTSPCGDVVELIGKFENTHTDPSEGARWNASHDPRLVSETTNVVTKGTCSSVLGTIGCLDADILNQLVLLNKNISTLIGKPTDGCGCQDEVPFDCTKIGSLCGSVSEIIAGAGTFPMSSGGTVTVSGVSTVGYAGSPQVGCGETLPAGPRTAIGSSIGQGPITLDFSQPVNGVRFYRGNVNASEVVTFDNEATCSTVIDCDNFVATPGGYETGASHAVSSHTIDYYWDTPITTLTATHNGQGNGVLVRVEVLGCSATVTNVTKRKLANTFAKLEGDAVGDAKEDMS